jgi:hypothetical protein
VSCHGRQIARIFGTVNPLLNLPPSAAPRPASRSLHCRTGSPFMMAAALSHSRAMVRLRELANYRHPMRPRPE